MKSKLKTLTFIFLGCTWIQLSMAQTVTISPEYNDPYKNIWHAGIYVGGDFQPNTGGLFLGGTGRFTLGKIATFGIHIDYDLTSIVGSGSLLSFDEELMAQLPDYKNFEVRGIFHLIDRQGTLNSKVKLGRGRDENGDEVKYSTSFDCESRNVFGITASLNIQSRLAGQSDSNHIIMVQDGNGQDLGYIDRLAIGQNNVMLGFGVTSAQFTWFKGTFTTNRSMTRRVRRTIIANFEFLYAMTIGTGDLAYYKKDANTPLTTYKLTDVEKRRLGFRISTDYSKNKPGLFQRMEIGYRPGVWAPSSNSKLLNQGYIVYALGIGF